MYSRSIPYRAASTVNRSGRVVGALEFAGEELQADVGGLEQLGRGGEFDAAAGAFVFVHDQSDRDTGGADLACQATARSSSGRIWAHR